MRHLLSLHLVTSGTAARAAILDTRFITPPADAGTTNQEFNMTFTKSTAVAAALVAVATFAVPFSAANAHGGKKHHFGHHRHHGLIVIGTPGPSCDYWLYKYKKTGKQKFLNRYYACVL